MNGAFHGDFVVMKNSLNEIIEFLNQIMRAIQQAAVQVSRTSNLVSENAYVIARNVDVVDKHTSTVRAMMEKAIASMNDGQRHMEDMLRAMDSINDNAEEIKKINKFLEDISFQTNILLAERGGWRRPGRAKRARGLPWSPARCATSPSRAGNPRARPPK